MTGQRYIVSQVQGHLGDVDVDLHAHVVGVFLFGAELRALSQRFVGSGEIIQAWFKENVGRVRVGMARESL